MFSEEGNTVRYVGMNFSICQSITRLLHGRIWHDVGYKEGTRFCFEIPKEPLLIETTD
jgi:light-regulated signal transduction histidine kinase (bacteriophytochrome)